MVNDWKSECFWFTLAQGMGKKVNFFGMAIKGLRNIIQLRTLQNVQKSPLQNGTNDMFFA